MNVKPSWQGYAVAVLTSLMLGGGGTFLVATAKIAHVKDELTEDIKEVSERTKDFRAVQIAILQSLVRLEEQVKYLREELDDR